MTRTKRKAADPTSLPPKRHQTRTSGTQSSNGETANGHSKKQILLNAFDMSTVGHLSPGQWKVALRGHYWNGKSWLWYQNPKDRSAYKRNLNYWIDLAKTLERGNINALFLADTYGGYDTYEGSLDNCIRRAAQWPVTDPTIVSFKREKRSAKLQEMFWRCDS